MQMLWREKLAIETKTIWISEHGHCLKWLFKELQFFFIYFYIDFIFQGPCLV